MQTYSRPPALATMACHCAGNCFSSQVPAAQAVRPISLPAAAWCSCTTSRQRRASPPPAGGCTCSRATSSRTTRCTSIGRQAAARPAPKADCWTLVSAPPACAPALSAPMPWQAVPRLNGCCWVSPAHHRRLSCYLFGRERRVADIPTDHPSCSKQHAVLQFRCATCWARRASQQRSKLRG